MYIRGSRYLPILTTIPLPYTCSKNSILIFFRCPFIRSVYSSLYLMSDFTFFYFVLSIIQIVYILPSMSTDFFVPKIHINKIQQEGVWLQHASRHEWIQPLLNNKFLCFVYRAQTPGVYQTYYSALIDKYHCRRTMCSQLQGAYNSVTQDQTNQTTRCISFVML